MVALSALITLGVLVLLVGYVVIKGLPFINPGIFAWKYTSENVSMMPAIINTVLMTALALIVAGPLGIFSAIYLVEYAKRGNKLVSVVRITAETLSGIPSIVLRLVRIFNVRHCLPGWGYSLLGGALTLAIMILPLVMRTTEALKSVPDTFRG